MLSLGKHALLAVPDLGLGKALKVRPRQPDTAGQADPGTDPEVLRKGAG
jgi:hypothetical protein